MRGRLFGFRYFLWGLWLSAAFCADTRSLFYLTRQQPSVASFLAHADRIDIVAPAWYTADGGGFITGAADPKVLETAHKWKVAVLPLVANPGFDPRILHALLRNPEARDRLARMLLERVKENQFAGIQLDFENVPPEDRDAFTALVRHAGKVFHSAGYQLSLAMYPGPPGRPSGYDLAALAREVDFLTLMTYDQHTLRTGPGPIGGYPWTEQSLSDALRDAPAEKISLGIPLYGGYWNRQFVHISGPQALRMAAREQALIRWDETERTHWFFFEKGGLRETVYFTDARSFAERLHLAQLRDLHSFSAWVLGMEEPAVWKLLPRKLPFPEPQP